MHNSVRSKSQPAPDSSSWADVGRPSDWFVPESKSASPGNKERLQALSSAPVVCARCCRRHSETHPPSLSKVKSSDKRGAWFWGNEIPSPHRKRLRPIATELSPRPLCSEENSSVLDVLDDRGPPSADVDVDTMWTSAVTLSRSSDDASQKHAEPRWACYFLSLKH